ncbi:radical SAM protein [Planctomycetota bacterium]
MNQTKLFAKTEAKISELPAGYIPRRPHHFDVEQIILTKGCMSTSERKQFVESICALYPDVPVIEKFDQPHNRVNLGKDGCLNLLQTGKRTLVFAEHKSALRFSSEENNTCPNYWHFSPTGFCPFGCKYCYLAGTPGVSFSPTVKVYVNFPEILLDIDKTANRIGTPTAFYLGKLQDALALDSLTGYSRIMIPFFALHPFARLTLLTKTADVENLLSLEHKNHSILSWSVNPPEVCSVFEKNIPSIESRIQAMQACAEAGYPIRAVLMPVIPIENWESIYGQFLEQLLESVPISRLTVGGICSYPDAKRLMENELGKSNAISQNIEQATTHQADHRARYSKELRISMYRHIINTARKIKPDIELALCLEEESVLKAVGLETSKGKCNCVL